MVKALEWFKKCLVLAEKHEFGAFLVSIGRDEVELFHLALEEDYHKDFILTILHRIDTDRAREISRRFSVTEGKYDLECNYLGRLEIRGSDARVVVPKWRTNRARTLFIMLSANHPRGCTKKELLDACWPKKDAEQAIHSLQVEVSSVRKILQDVLGKRFDHDNLIICRAGKYSLNPVLAIKKDIQQFEALVHEASLRESADPAASIKLYGQACGMYRGDFCSNLSFDWCAANRSYYRGIIMKVLKKMASLHYGLQEHDKALKLYQQAAALDQYDEAIHIGIMRCLFALRDADGAQRQYGLLARMLRELDIPQPSVEATEIYKASLH